ncbi:hypothetical protein N1851_017015 [Merluccius polli]|uniref:THAP-type domain-containing protein n=1 Tax=Merluccius polli TaxID=89951 RepID=A0AA47MQE7_MERPO|nr:hypothetical protein N1851_017015 [Merluccius polli]
MDISVKKRKFKVRNRFKLQRSEGGSNEHCCVPLCSASSRYNSSLSFHCFPKNSSLRVAWQARPTSERCKASLRAQWIHKIKRTGFIVTNHMKVCSRHFEEKLIRSTAKGRWVLLPNSIPSLFEWNKYLVKQTRAGVWERRARPSSPEPGSNPEDPEHEDELPVPMVLDHEYSASRTVCVDREHYINMQTDIEVLRQQLESYHLQTAFGLQRFASSPEDIRFYTRSIELIIVKLRPIDELFLFLIYLSTGYTQRDLGHRFHVHRATVSRIIVTWVNFLYSLLGSVSIWMSPEAVKAHIPQEYNIKFSQLHVSYLIIKMDLWSRDEDMKNLS